MVKCVRLGPRPPVNMPAHNTADPAKGCRKEAGSLLLHRLTVCSPRRRHEAFLGAAKVWGCAAVDVACHVAKAKGADHWHRTSAAELRSDPSYSKPPVACLRRRGWWCASRRIRMGPNGSQRAATWHATDPLKRKESVHWA